MIGVKYIWLFIDIYLVFALIQSCAIYHGKEDTERQSTTHSLRRISSLVSDSIEISQGRERNSIQCRQMVEGKIVEPSERTETKNAVPVGAYGLVSRFFS